MERRTARHICQQNEHYKTVGITDKRGIVRTFRDGKGRAPLVSQNIQANAAVGVDIWVVNASGEVDLGGFERIVGGKVNGKKEDTAGVW